MPAWTMCDFSLTRALTSPWQSSLRKGYESGRSTRRLSCSVLARNTPRNQKSFVALF